jgi:transposase
MAVLSETANSNSIEAGGRRGRRVWSPEQKRLMVEEARRPGASVADVAQRNGLNANLLFAWKRAAEDGLGMKESRAEPVAIEPGFVPIELRGAWSGSDVRDACDRPSSSAAAARRERISAGTVPAHADLRSGTIEIELPGGTLVRVDECVSERALRRVLAALRSAS